MPNDEMTRPIDRNEDNADADRLRDAESLFRSLVHSIPACFLRKDRDGRIVFVNENFANLFGKRADEIVGKTVADFYPRDFAEDARKEDERVMQSGQVLEDIFEDFVDGKLHYYASRKGPVRNERGQVIGIQTIFWDITEQRVAENALIEEREKLRAARDAADEANRAKSDFLANMSHEIRTPMNAIIGMTDLLLDTELTPTQHEYLRMVQDSGEALLTLINDILDFSKIEAGKLELEQTSFDVRESLGDSMKGLGFRAHDKGLELAFRVDEQIPKLLLGDPGRIRQIVVNLVGNAIKFTRAGEVVLEIECASKSHDLATLRFSVIDTGIGIAPEHCRRIFREFEQADASTTRRFGGTGLGLAICSRLVQMMNGRIWVESEQGRGSRFNFELPLEIDRQHASTRTGDSNVSIRGVRVLIVDDNATNRRILKDMLTNWGMHPVTSSGGALALQALADANDEGDAFQLLISDVNMPEMDGIKLARTVLDRRLLKPASVIMLTSGARPNDTVNLQSIGVSQHLIKPAKQSEIYDAIMYSLSAMGVTTSMPSGKLPGDSLTGSLAKLRILLAEDNVVNQKLALGILEKLGHRVTVAMNGREALDQIQAHSFDLILMDVQMPEMDGLAATRELRRREQTSQNHLPVIAMTAHAMKGDRERCLEAGMDDYLCKPIRMKDVSDMLAKLFSQNRDALHDPAANTNSVAISWSEVLANVGGDRQLLGELIKVFLDDTPALMTAAANASQAENTDELSRTAHMIKGAMLFLDPGPPLDCAARVESAAANGDLAAAQISLSDLQRHFDDLCQCLRSYQETRY